MDVCGPVSEPGSLLSPLHGERPGVVGNAFGAVLTRLSYLPRRSLDGLHERSRKIHVPEKFVACWGSDDG